MVQNGMYWNSDHKKYLHRHTYTPFSQKRSDFGHSDKKLSPYSD